MPKRIALVAVMALGCVACNSTHSNIPGPVLAAAPGAGPAIAFESIDGPPANIYSKFVRSLSEEADARQVAVASRGAPAHYRVRVYVATVVYPKRSVLHWVWDVYEGNRQRAFRIAGEEPMTASGRTTAWAAADDQVIRKITRAGMERLVAHVGSASHGPPPPAPPASPPSAGPAIAMAAEH